MSQWAVVMAKPNSEAIAVLNLERQGYTVYFPRFAERRISKPTLIKPLFPRYLFVLFDKVWYSIKGTRGVSYVLMGDDGPAVLPQSVIDGFKAREDQDGFIQLSKQVPLERFAQGQEVKVTDGPFVGLPLIYEGMSAKERVKVLVEIMGRKAVVEVNEKSLVAV